MNVPIPGPHRSQWGAEVSAHCIQNRLAERQPPGGVPDQRGKNVASSQRQANRRAESLLATPEKDAAMNFAHAIEAGKFVVQKTRQQHEAVRFNVPLAK